MEKRHQHRRLAGAPEAGRQAGDRHGQEPRRFRRGLAQLLHLDLGAGDGTRHRRLVEPERRQAAVRLRQPEHRRRARLLRLHHRGRIRRPVVVEPVDGRHGGLRRERARGGNEQRQEEGLSPHRAPQAGESPSAAAKNPPRRTVRHRHSPPVRSRRGSEG